MIKIEDLTIEYPDGTVAIDGMSLEIQGNESVAIVGANGAGKSTLLKAIIGLADIKEGTIEVDGHILGSDRKKSKDEIRIIRKKIGMIFQDPDDQLFMVSVLEDVLFGLRNAGMDEEEAKEKAETILKELAIEKLKNKVPGRMSSGEKRLAALAGVLVLEPEYIFFDEPATFLDRKSKRKLIDEIDSIGSAKIIVTHDFELVQKLCDRVIVLKDGKVAFDGSRDEWNNILDDNILEEWNM